MISKREGAGVIHIGGIKPLEGGAVQVAMKDRKEVKFNSLKEYVTEMKKLRYLGRSILVEESPVLHDSVKVELLEIPASPELESIYSPFGEGTIMNEEDEDPE